MLLPINRDFGFFKMAVAAILNFWPRYGHFLFFKDGGRRHLGF